MREEDRFAIQVHKVVDTLATGLAFVLAYLAKVHLFPLQYRGLIQTPNYHVILLLAIIIWYAGFQYFDFHSEYGRRKAGPLLIMILRALLVQAGILALFFYVFRIKDVSRALIVVFVVLDFFLLVASMQVRLFIMRRQSRPSTLLVIIGSREAARDLLKSIGNEPSLGCTVMGCLDTDPSEVGNTVFDGIKVVGTLNQLQQILTEYVVDEIIFAMPIGMIWEAEQYLTIAETVGVKIRILPHWHVRKFMSARPRFYSMHFEEYFGNPTLVLTATSRKRGALLVKSLVDYSVAMAVLAFSFPIALLAGCLIKLLSPGPVFYKQERCSIYGRMFTMYKFRTMVPGAEKMQEDLSFMNEADGPVFKIVRDPRVIPYVGAFLRRTGLDELPQIINVLLGDMSIVGPRPPIPKEVTKYQLWERRRLSMKPGITCSWQIAPHRNKLSFEQWMKMDLDYIDNWTLWLDLKIIFMTFKAMILRYGA